MEDFLLEPEGILQMTLAVVLTVFEDQSTSCGTLSLEPRSTTRLALRLRMVLRRGQTVHFRHLFTLQSHGCAFSIDEKTFLLQSVNTDFLP